MSSVPVTNARKRVLLFDVDHRRREIRAANLRMRGVDVVCAKNVSEVRDFWHVNTFQLVLLDAAESPEVIGFSREVRSDDPRQRLAFFVGKPEYLANLPAQVLPPGLPLPSVDRGVTLEEAFKTLSSRNGFVEASLRMQMLRSSRRGATTVRPAPDPWEAMKGTTDSD